VPTVAVSSQYRSASKHRPPAAEAPTKITVGEMLRMPALPEGDRATHTPPTDTEKTARVLDAFVFLAKIEGNDCDIHLEVGDRDGGDHVIVEVPSGAGYNGARRAVLEKLGVSALSTHPHKPKTPVPMRFTGYAFYDGTHYSRADPQRGNHHGGAEVGTLWELHPVWGVE